MKLGLWIMFRIPWLLLSTLTHTKLVNCCVLFWARGHFLCTLNLINVWPDQQKTTPKGNCEIQQPELVLNSLPKVVALCQHPFSSCGTQLKGTTPYPLFTVALYPNVCFDSSSSPVKWMMVWKKCAGDSAAGPNKKKWGGEKYWSELPVDGWK